MKSLLGWSSSFVCLFNYRPFIWGRPTMHPLVGALGWILITHNWGFSVNHFMPLARSFWKDARLVSVCLQVDEKCQWHLVFARLIWRGAGLPGSASSWLNEKLCEPFDFSQLCAVITFIWTDFAGIIWGPYQYYFCDQTIRPSLSPWLEEDRSKY